MTADLEQVKQAHPIADVIAAHGVKLRQTGRRFMGRCPFHNDDRPSLVVYPDTRSFHCFGCGSTGDVIDFVRRTQDVGFREALAYLGDQPATATIPARGREPRVASSQLSLDDRVILTVACELYHETLLRTPHALRYLEERKIPRWLVRRARLGYSDGRHLATYLKRRRLSLRRAVEMGLLYPDESQDGEREAMRGRVVIPDLRAGHCGWMTGRLPVEDARVPYLGLALPKPLLGYEAARDWRRVFLVEGPFDWLTLRGWGLPACALLGTQLGAGTLPLLEHARSVVLVLDADEAGREAAGGLAETLGARARTVALPEGIKDVNELAQQSDGRAIFFQLLDETERRARDAASAQ